MDEVARAGAGVHARRRSIIDYQPRANQRNHGSVFSVRAPCCACGAAEMFCRGAVDSMKRYRRRATDFIADVILLQRIPEPAISSRGAAELSASRSLACWAPINWCSRTKLLRLVDLRERRHRIEAPTAFGKKVHGESSGYSGPRNRYALRSHAGLPWRFGYYGGAAT